MTDVLGIYLFYGICRVLLECGAVFILRFDVSNFLSSRYNLSEADEEKNSEIVFMDVTRLREIMEVRLVQLVLISFEEQTIM